MEEIRLQAKLTYVIYHNESNGYTVARFTTYDKEEKTFTGTGYLHDLEKDMVLDMSGCFIEHPRYGVQLQIHTCHPATPSDRLSLIRFFSSALFPGIGVQTATKLVDILGENCLDRIREDASCLLLVKGLSAKKRELLRQGVEAYGDTQSTSGFFSRYGINPRFQRSFEAAYGEDAVAIIRENPYRMVEDIEGIGFRTADKLAKELQFPKDHPYRIKAAILSMVMQLCMTSGDTYVTYEELEQRVYKEFGDVTLDDYLQQCCQQRLLIQEEDRIYHHTQYDSEKGIAAFLSGFPYVEDHQLDTARLYADIQRLEKELHIEYDRLQKEAIVTFFKAPFSLLSGGPGTGKTTIVQGILALYQTYYPSSSIVCCAPTGRAAKRLSELCGGIAASTIHSLLKWDMEINAFLVNEREPLQADMLIVDEFSMVDQWLFYHLLRAGKGVRRILLIGDEDQLPSVGCGSVLKDLIQSELFPLTRLSKIFRQDEGSEIADLAHAIRCEQVELAAYQRDVRFLPCESYAVKDVVRRMVTHALNKGYSDKDIQVLAPMYSGAAGIDALNSMLQQMMNPPAPHKEEVRIGYRIFRVHDKVLQLKNQPEDNVYNGDIGEIMAIEWSDTEHTSVILTADFDGILVTYSGEQLSNITHAYCISIHKAQGSEYPIVLLPIVKEHAFMLSKRLLYTGITRARKSLVLLGSAELFLKSIELKERHVRKSTLSQRLAESLYKS